MNYKFMKNLLSQKIFVLSFLICMCSFSFDIQAATVTIKVKSGNQKIKGANLCLGDSSNKTKYGFATTDSKGEAVFENVPNSLVTLIVYKTGYNGQQTTFSPNTDVVVPFNLAPGDQGPTCLRSTRVSPVNQPLKKSTAFPKNDQKSTKITPDNQPVSKSSAFPKKDKTYPTGSIEPIKPILDKPTVCTWKQGSLSFSNLEDLTRKNGFSSGLISEDFGSECELSWEIYEIRITVGSPEENLVDALKESIVGSKCDYRLFGGKKLEPGWKVNRFGSKIGRSGTCVNSSASFDKKPMIGSDSLETKVHVWADPGNTCSMSINQIQVEGPPGKECWEAFGNNR